MYTLLYHRGCKHHLSPRHRWGNQFGSVEVSAAVAGLVAMCRGTKTAFSAMTGISRGVKCTAAAADACGGGGRSGLGAVRAVGHGDSDPPAQPQYTCLK